MLDILSDNVIFASRLEFLVRHNEGTWSVSVEARPAGGSPVAAGCSRTPLALSGVVSPPSTASVHKETYDKHSPVLTFSDAYEVRPRACLSMYEALGLCRIVLL